MTGRAPIFRVVAAALILMLSGCLDQKSFLDKGDASSAEVLYPGDVAGALTIAKEHCAGYGRVARLVDTIPGKAYFACDSP